MSVDIQRIKDFHKQHGDYITIQEKGIILYENGAYRDTVPEGILADPPENKIKRTKYILLFWKTKAERAEQAFLEKKSQFRAMANDGKGYSGMLPATPNSNEEMKSILLKLKKDAVLCGTRMRAARKEAEAALPFSPEKDRQMAAEAESRRSEIFAGLEEIKL